MVQNAGLGVGSLLRQRREELGQDIEAVSRQLRIRAIYIRAIEEGRLQDLPGTAYAVGFVRTYADFLGFDGNSVVADYRDELGQRTRTEPVSWRMEERESHFPGGKLLIVCLILAGIGYGGWYYLSNTPTGAGLIESVPDYLKKGGGEAETKQPAEAPKTAQTAPSTSGEGAAGEAPTSSSPESAQTTADSSTASGATTAETGSAGETTNNSDNGAATGGDTQTGGTEENTTSSTPSTEGTEPTSPADTSASPAAPAVPGEAAETGAASAESGTASPDVAAAAASTATRVNIHAKLESWVQIVDKDGKPILSRVLRAGESYSVPDQPGLVMSTGNAGGIEMLLDGKPLQNLGAVGLVRRNISLDPDKLASGAAFLKTPAPAPASGGSGNSGD